MKIAVVGAGAVGCTLAAWLHRKGVVPSLVARGGHARQLNKEGLRFTDEHGDHHYSFPIVTSILELEPQDVLILTTKSYSLPDIAPDLKHAMHDDTLIIPGCNGIPWWFLKHQKGKLSGYSIQAIDPNGLLARHMDTSHILGGLFYMGATYEGPGHVSHYRRPKFLLGSTKDDTKIESASPMAREFVDLLKKAGVAGGWQDQMRSAILKKLAWNIAFNPLSVIYNKHSLAMSQDEALCDRARSIIGELQHIADKLGISVDCDPEGQIELSRVAGAHQPSMLQDYNAGKQLEYKAICCAPQELAVSLDIPTPALDAVVAQLETLMITS